MSDNPTLSRRKALALIGTGGALLAHSAAKGFAQTPASSPRSDSSAAPRRFATVAALKEADGLKAGEWVETSGYFQPGDGGNAVYQIKPAGEEKGNDGDIVAIKNGLTANLAESEAVNYRMFGASSDGKSDDGVAIKNAHAYASARNIPVVNLSGEYWIKETNYILITTNVHWGKSVFHIDESFNTPSRPRFAVRNDEAAKPIEFDEETKAAFLEKLKPGVQIIPELAPYAGCLISIADAEDRIGIRAGPYSKRGWAREELFYVEEEGRIIGDVAWKFKNYTTLTATPCNKNYLVIEGGGFLYSGDNPGERSGTYYHHGILIQRSRTIIRQQWMGLEPGRKDVSLTPRRGFYSLNRVYDVTLEDIRAMPWEQNRSDPAKDVPSGTYGIAGARMLHCTFRNLTAEGGWVSWGVFGTNLNKNFRLENCRLNRVDVHFHCWNLYISNCEIGVRGISVTGGGDLFIENTTRHGNHFVNFRRDYGAKWDGRVRIRGCTLRPSGNSVVSVLYHRMADFDYQYPIGFARSISIDDFVIDYRGAPASSSICWLINCPSFSRTKNNDRLFFPAFAEFRNIRVIERDQGIRLLHLPEPYHYDTNHSGGYDGVRFAGNSKLIFDNIHLEALTPKNPNDRETAHFVLGGEESAAYADDRALYPIIEFNNCSNLTASLHHCAATVAINRCSVNLVQTAGLRGALSFTDCQIEPRIAALPANAALWPVDAPLGTRFTNCTIHAPNVGGQPRPEQIKNFSFFEINGKVRHFHLNTTLGSDILAHLRQLKIKLNPDFIRRLASRHALEEDETE